MSVINKMLRDLDQRQVTRTGAPGQPGSMAGAGTSALPFGRTPSAGVQSRRRLWLGLLLAVVAGAVAARLWLQGGGQLPGGLSIIYAPPAPTPLIAAAQTPAVSQAAVAATPGAAPAVPAVADGPTPSATTTVATTEAPGSMVLRMESSLSARRAMDALLSTPTPVPVAAAAPTPAPEQSAPERSKSRPVPSGTSAPVASSNAPTVIGDSTPVLQRQQQAGGDALAQAQSLWNTGSRDAAMDLVQQSIAVAERAAKSAGGTGANPVLLPLVREMARMQLAEGRYGAVWEMLTRLEPLLGNQPDLWAIRANAAQRLGRHPDSVHAYMMALQSRPDEQRWLLGTAVSLAALGQTASAAEMAEKARAQGPVGKDILAYLRQAGVPLKE
ncbi:MAG: tetratricopeptide repeat protein [Burkholderiales bacterium]|nr:tetratricopeptide repeat protein [Burkholderiales bacterium]